MELTLESFTAQAMDEGFDEMVVREWAPGLVIDTHTHAFAVSARVVRGEFWLTVDGSTRHIPEGESFRLARDVPHAERYGAQGATVWVARAT
jgi:quercetin dioxygenase-like cupin family protein